MKQIKLDKTECRLLLSCIKQEPQTRKKIFLEFFAKAGDYDPMVCCIITQAREHDRRLRAVIAKMVSVGYPIITTQKGYCLDTKRNIEIFQQSQSELLCRQIAAAARYKHQLNNHKTVMGQKRVKCFGHYWDKINKGGNKA